MKKETNISVTKGNDQMSGTPDNTRISLLLARAAAGVINETESEELNAWRNEDSHNDEIYRQATDPDFIGEQTALYSTIDTESALSHVAGKLNGKARRQRLRRLTAAAAVLAIPILAVSIFVLNNRREDSMPIMARAEQQANQVKAELFTEDAYITGGSITESVYIQDGIDVSVENGIIYYNASPDADELQPVTTNILRIPAGEKETVIVLSDGTSVMLNAESMISFPSRFTGEERRVTLSGEAFFNVTHNSEQPFFVELDNSRTIKVLGTSFNVSSYEDDTHTFTTLTEGMVLFTAGEKSVILQPGEQAVCNMASGELEKREVDTSIYTAWTQGRLVFENERLESIMKKLARTYNINVVWENEAQKDVLFRVVTSRYDDFAPVAEIIEKTGNITFGIEGGNVYIR